MRFISSGSAISDDARKFVSDVVNIRSIGVHFKPKIDAWSSSNEVVSITPDQVGVLRSLSSPLLYIQWKCT